MANQISAPEVHASGDQPQVSNGRRQFTPPVVEELGKLQALTQFLQITGIP